MGKKQHGDLKTLAKLSDPGHTWGVAQAELDAGPLMVRYNESARSWVGHPQLPIKLGFAVPLNSPEEGGLPNADENEQLNAIEDILIAKVESATPAIQALVLTTGLMREFIFYVPRDVDIGAIHLSAQKAVDTHEIQCMATNEPTWDSFTEFTP